LMKQHAKLKHTHDQAIEASLGKPSAAMQVMAGLLRNPRGRDRTTGAGGPR
jgi:hypothetical protein